MDKCAGIGLLHKVGDEVNKDEVPYRIHAHSVTGLTYVRELASTASRYAVTQ